MVIRVVIISCKVNARLTSTLDGQEMVFADRLIELCAQTFLKPPEKKLSLSGP